MLNRKRFIIYCQNILRKKIYTVNIDDLVEHICYKNHIDFVVQNTSKEKPVKDELEYVNREEISHT